MAVKYQPPKWMVAIRILQVLATIVALSLGILVDVAIAIALDYSAWIARDSSFMVLVVTASLTLVYLVFVLFGAPSMAARRNPLILLIVFESLLIALWLVATILWGLAARYSLEGVLFVFGTDCYDSYYYTSYCESDLSGQTIAAAAAASYATPAIAGVVLILFVTSLWMVIVLYRRGKKAPNVAYQPATMYAVPGGYMVPQAGFPVAGQVPMPPQGYTHAVPAMAQPGAQPYGMVYYYPVAQAPTHPGSPAPPMQAHTPWAAQPPLPSELPHSYPAPAPNYQQPYTRSQDSETAGSPQVSSVTPKTS